MPGAIYEPFDVVVVPHPLTARAAAERRPALVVSSPGFNDRHNEVILAMIIAATAAGWPSDAVLRDWRGAGLPTACKVRARLFTVDRAVIVRRLGALGPGDRRVVGGLLSGSFAFV
jgi:mRNA interferase MazF